MHAAPTDSPTAELVPATLPALFSMWCSHQWANVSAVVMWRARLVTNVKLCTGTSPLTLLMDAPTVSVTLQVPSVGLQSVHRKLVSVTVSPTLAVEPAPPVKMATTTCRSTATLAARVASVTLEVHRVSLVERGTAVVAAGPMWRGQSVIYLVQIITSQTSTT